MLVAILKENFAIACSKVVLLTNFLSFVNTIGSLQHFEVVNKQYHLIVNKQK